MTSHCGVKQVGLLMLIYPDLTRSALEKRHPSFPSFIIIIIMAYNREWDMGKESWHDGGSWGLGLATAETMTMEREEEEVQRLYARRLLLHPLC
jgi:hypothetical protein